MEALSANILSQNEIDEKKCVRLANKLIVNLSLLLPRITTRLELKSKLYFSLFEHLFGFKLKSNGDESDKFCHLLKGLETILATSVNHIEVQALCCHELQSHCHLLEIFDACYRYLPNLSGFSKTTKAVSKYVQTDTSKSDSPITTTTPSSTSTYMPSAKSNSYSSFSICDCPDIIQSTPEFEEYKNGLKYSTTEDEKQRYEDVNVADNFTEPKQIMTAEEAKERIKHLSKQPKRFVSKPLKTSEVWKRIEQKPNNRLATRKDLSEKLDFNAPSSKLLEQLQTLTIENFALDIGKRLHSALKLKEKTKQIADNIEKLNQLVENPTNIPKTRKVVTQKRKSIPIRRVPTVRSNDINKTKKIITKAGNIKPKDIRTDNLRIVSVNDFLPHCSDIPGCLLKVMRQYESRQKQAIVNLQEDLKTSEARITKDLREAILKQMRKSAFLKDDVQHMQNLDRIKGEEIEQLSEAAMIREWRLERARIHKFVENYHREMLSKFKAFEAREEQMLREEFFRRLRSQKEDLLEFKKRVKEEESKEVRKQRMFLEAFETLYNNNFDMLKQNLDQQESAIKKRLLQRTTSLNKLRTHFTHRLNDQMKSICK